MKQSPNFFSASIIARAANCHHRTIHRRATRAAWPRRQNGNLFEYQPPRALHAKCLLISRRTKAVGLRAFDIGAERRAEVFRAHNRFAALCGLEIALENGMQIERALARVGRDFTFHCSPRNLRKWQRRFSKEGFAGLLEKKRGYSGRKPKAKR
jgi:hypothetical protein